MLADVFIDYGISDWEVKQQINGYAEFEVGGRCYLHPENDNEILPESGIAVMVRVVKEETDEPVTEWLCADTSNEKWNIGLKLPCGGPYRLSTVLKCSNEGDFWVERNPSGDDIHHFCVGDVYVIAGQSNAAGTGRGIMSDPPEIGVHVFRNCNKWDLATNPFYSKRGFHGPFLSFAKYLKKELGYPIGLIPCAYGGSPLKEWVKDESGYWYNEMLAVLKNNRIAVKGVLWYQGCSDAAWGDPSAYLSRFKQFVENIRDDLKQTDLPIVTFQLNRHTDDFPDNTWVDGCYDAVREAQRLAARTIKNVFIVPTVDSGKMTDGIHNSRAANVLLGERAALNVLSNIYHKGLDFSAPDIEKAVFESSNSIMLEFSHVADCLMAFHVAAADLPISVEDERGTNDIIAYKIEKNKIYLELTRKIDGICTLKCQYGRNPRGYIHDIGRQMPVLCFSNIRVEKQ